MVYNLTYRRPPRVDSKRGSVASGQTGPSIGGSTLGDSQDVSINYGIPEALSFDRIIDGGTCPVRNLVYQPVPTPHRWEYRMQSIPRLRFPERFLKAVHVAMQLPVLALEANPSGCSPARLVTS